jgi:hypothetical protein
MHGYSHAEILDISFVVNSVASLLFVVFSFPLESKNSDGVIALLTGLVFVAFIPVSYYSLRMSPSRTGIGVVLGASVIMIMIALQTAIFWGQSGNCKIYSISPNDSHDHELRSHRYLQGEHNAPPSSGMGSEYIRTKCSSAGAMKRLCAVSVFLFLYYIYFVGVLYQYSDEIVATCSDYCLVSTSSGDEGLEADSVGPKLDSSVLSPPTIP